MYFNLDSKYHWDYTSGPMSKYHKWSEATICNARNLNAFDKCRISALLNRRAGPGRRRVPWYHLNNVLLHAKYGIYKFCCYKLTKHINQLFLSEIFPSIHVVYVNITKIDNTNWEHVFNTVCLLNKTFLLKHFNA